VIMKSNYQISFDRLIAVIGGKGVGVVKLLISKPVKTYVRGTTQFVDEAVTKSTLALKYLIYSLYCRKWSTSSHPPERMNPYLTYMLNHRGKNTFLGFLKLFLYKNALFYFFLFFEDFYSVAPKIFN